MLPQFKQNKSSDWILAFLHKWYLEILILMWWYLEMGSLRGCGSGALLNGISAVIEKTAQSSLAPPPGEDTASKQQSAAWKKGSPEPGHTATPIWDFPPVRNVWLCWEATQSLYFVMALRWLKHLDTRTMSLTPCVPSSDLTVTGAALSYQTHHQRRALVTLGGSGKGCEEKPVGLMLQNKETKRTLMVK